MPCHAYNDTRADSQKNLLQQVNDETVAEVTKFIVDLELESKTGLPHDKIGHTLICSPLIGKIPAGLIVAKPGAETYSSLISSIAENIKAHERAIMVNLTTSQAPNLKSVLKYINQHATNQDPAIVDEEMFVDRQKVVRLNLFFENISY